LFFEGRFATDPWSMKDYGSCVPYILFLFASPSSTFQYFSIFFFFRLWCSPPFLFFMALSPHSMMTFLVSPALDLDTPSPFLPPRPPFDPFFPYLGLTFFPPFPPRSFTSFFYSVEGTFFSGSRGDRCGCSFEIFPANRSAFLFPMSFLRSMLTLLFFFPLFG